MELKDILHYRETCLFCQGPMNYHCTEYPNLGYQVTDDFFQINSPFKNTGVIATFYFDGKFARCKRNLKLFKKPIVITKVCDACLSESKSPVNTKLIKNSKGHMSHLSPRNMSNDFFTAINNLMAKECAYKFQLMGDAQGNYAPILVGETTRYFNDKSFWHIDTSFLTKVSVMHHGNWDDTLDQVLSLRITTPINVGNVPNAEQFVQKFKTYVMMS